MELAAVDGVVLDEVDFARDVLAELRQFPRVLKAVVEVLEHDELKRRARARLVDKVTQRLGQDRQIVGLVDGHDVVALGVVGGVQAECEIEFDLVVSQALDRFGNARRGHGDALGRHRQSGCSRDALHRFDHVAVVQQRFAHAHVDNVGQALVVLLMRERVQHLDLVVHLPCCEVLQQLEAPRRTKLARQAAPYLRADARREPLGGGDQHALHHTVGVAVDLERALHRAVLAVLGLHLIDAMQRKRLRQLGAKAFAQRRHVVERPRRMRPQPLRHLLGAERLLSHVHQRGGQFFLGKGANVRKDLSHGCKDSLPTHGLFLRPTSTATSAASRLLSSEENEQNAACRT